MLLNRRMKLRRLFFHVFIKFPIRLSLFRNLLLEQLQLFLHSILFPNTPYRFCRVIIGFILVLIEDVSALTVALVEMIGCAPNLINGTLGMIFQVAARDLCNLRTLLNIFQTMSTSCHLNGYEQDI